MRRDWLGFLGCVKLDSKGELCAARRTLQTTRYPEYTQYSTMQYSTVTQYSAVTVSLSE